MLSLLGEIPAFHNDRTIPLFGADGVLNDFLKSS